MRVEALNERLEGSREERRRRRGRRQYWEWEGIRNNRRRRRATLRRIERKKGDEGASWRSGWLREGREGGRKGRVDEGKGGMKEQA